MESAQALFSVNVRWSHCLPFPHFPPVTYVKHSESAKYLASNINDVRVSIEEWNQQTTWWIDVLDMQWLRQIILCTNHRTSISNIQHSTITTVHLTKLNKTTYTTTTTSVLIAVVFQVNLSYPFPLQFSSSTCSGKESLGIMDHILFLSPYQQQQISPTKLST